MNDLESEKPHLEPTPPALEPAEAGRAPTAAASAPSAPPQARPPLPSVNRQPDAGSVVRRRESPRVREDTLAAADRRDFFSDAMRETLAPFTGILQRRINPLLAALEAIPNEAEKLAQFEMPRVLDQPQTRTLPLPLQAPQAAPLPEQYLRPPGAMAPGEFESVCSRCGLCVQACPAHAILLDGYGLEAQGLPYIRAAVQPCVVCDDLACMKACPTGALKLVDRLKIKMGTAKVDVHQCVRDRGENCSLCVEACPITGSTPDGVNAGVGDGIVESTLGAIFIHSHSGRVRVRKNVCVGCGLCESRCPTNPPAITVMAYSPPVDPIIA